MRRHAALWKGLGRRLVSVLMATSIGGLWLAPRASAAPPGSWSATGSMQKDCVRDVLSPSILAPTPPGPTGQVTVVPTVFGLAALPAVITDVILPLANDPTCTWTTDMPGGLENNGLSLTKLVSGNVLFVSQKPFVEVYNAAAGTWSVDSTPRTLYESSGQGGYQASGNRNGRSSPVLLNNGKVLVQLAESDAGNVPPWGLYDETQTAIVNTATPTASASTGSGKWSPAATNLPTCQHLGGSTTLLNDGTVLLVGGREDGTECSGQLPTIDDTKVVDRYNPGTGPSWSRRGDAPASFDGGHTATKLANGKVLVVQAKTAELYDPTADLWSAVAAPTHNLTKHSAVLLNSSGKVLFAGGDGDSGSAVATVYDPAANTWTDVSVGASACCLGNTGLTVLASGNVLVTDSNGAHWVYEPAGNNIVAAAANATPRVNGSAVPLGNGKVLFAGGHNATTGATEYTSELYSE